MTAGALVVDMRPADQRERDGELPGAIVIDRNVLAWRLDPTSPDRRADIDFDVDARVILVCNEGYNSSLVSPQPPSVSSASGDPQTLSAA
ncbi:MAG: rhodanese-like domain-containing protein, partial [Marmoricola sp.]